MRARLGIPILTLGLVAAGLHASTLTYGQDDPWDNDEDWAASCQDENDHKGRARLCGVRIEGIPAPHRMMRIDGGKGGAVGFRGWDRDSVVIHCRIQVDARDRREAESIARHIRVVTDGPTIHAEGPPSGDAVSWSVSLHVAVPRRSDLTAETHNGPISAERVEGTLDLRTVNGPVELTVPAGYNGRLEAGTTHGPINALDMPVTEGRTGGRRVVAQLGSGGPTVRAVTRNGPVPIHQPGSESD